MMLLLYTDVLGVYIAGAFVEILRVHETIYTRPLSGAWVLWLNDETGTGKFPGETHSLLLL